ncbi:hypothetical protein JYT91_01305 [archaeon AH-315-M20]|nr:hypothetical protein [archaeon AH-315-M20]
MNQDVTPDIEDLDTRLHRALEHIFQDPGTIIDTFKRVFTSYPLEKLETLEDEAELERILSRISKRKDVQEMRDWIDIEINAGEDTLQSVVAGIVLNNLPHIGIIPQDKLTNYGEYLFQEVWALSYEDGDRPKRVAMGQFPMEIALDNLVFTPDNVFYGENLQWNITPREKPNLRLDENISIIRAARSIVFRDMADKKTARKTVKEVIKYAVDELHKGLSIKILPYQRFENELVKSLMTMFPDVINENRSINYRKLNSIFRLVRRRNISLDSYLGNAAFRGKLEEGIEKFVQLPYAVVRTRTKQRERAFEKYIEAFYDLRMEGYRGGPKSFRDMHGIRVILPTKDDIYKYVGQLKKTLGLRVIEGEEKDYVKKPKPNGYQSYHMSIEFAGRAYDMQIRTHEMDYAAEQVSRQAHEVGFMREKIRLIGATPLPVRRVIGTLLGLYTPAKKAA